MEAKQVEGTIQRGNLCDRCKKDLRAREVGLSGVRVFLCTRCEAIFIGNAEYQSLVLEATKAIDRVEAYVKEKVFQSFQ